MCSSDIVAAVTILDPEKQPKLFSIVLGEGLFNDAVSIILFQSMADIVKKDKKDGYELSAEAILEIIKDFVILAIVSILIGVSMGMVSSLMTKYFRVIAHSAVSESAFLILIAMMSYFISETSHMSGIVTLLVTSVLMTHYTWYNLSPQGKHVSSVLF